LVGNKVGPQGAIALADTISNNDSIAHINLRDNHIGDKGAKAWAQAVQKNETIEELNLGSKPRITVVQTLILT